jgi:sterol desaturase/sphingolipid hydroxylase (fatty acid hydroxylase superfamily)
VRRWIAATVFPAIFVIAILASVAALEHGVPAARVLLAVSLTSILSVILLERILPFRREWNHSHGDLAADATYLPLTVGVNALVEPGASLVGVVIGGWLAHAIGMGLWPSAWPLVAQLALACVVAELFDYWAHRVMHEHGWLWRLHATHHSAPRLYWLNATRSHPLEMVFRGAVGILPLAILGADQALFALVGVVNIVVGLFQHANIDFTLGPLSWVFSVGELHRWHHSQELDEANSNYGNNFIFWDAVFQTRYLSSVGGAPARVGIAGLDRFPRRVIGQLLAPLHWSSIAPGAPRSGDAST